MTQSASIQFVDSRHGKSCAAVQKLEGGVEIAMQLSELPSVVIQMRSSAAIQLARAILTAAGEAAALPQSRQIGGIIGPY